MNIALWIAQGLLAAMFLFAGGMKLVIPIEEMLKQMPIPLPGWFLRFTGVVEVLGAIGVILPWLLRIRPALTPFAAAGRRRRRPTESRPPAGSAPMRNHRPPACTRWRRS